MLILRWRKRRLEVSQWSYPYRLDHRHGLDTARALVCARLHLGGRDRQQIHLPGTLGECVQSGGAGACRHVLYVPHGPELVGRAARSSVDRFGGAHRDGRVHRGPGKQDPAGAHVFLGTYFALFTFMAFPGEPGKVADMFRAPDLHAALFFAFFILTDPPTSPVKYRGQIVCGVLVAAVSFAIFEWNGAAYYLLAGVLVGNVFEAWHRWQNYRRAGASAQITPMQTDHVTA